MYYSLIVLYPVAILLEFVSLDLFMMYISAGVDLHKKNPKSSVYLYFTTQNREIFTHTPLLPYYFVLTYTKTFVSYC